MTLPVSEVLRQRQVNRWNKLRAYLEQQRPPPRAVRRPVITVSRLCGSGGRLLAETLATKLELELKDRSLVDRIARDKSLETGLVAQLDKNVIDQAALWIQGLLKRRIFLRDEYHVALVKTVSRLASRGGVVFLGRGANLILGTNADLRIRLTAPRDIRLKNLRRRTQLSKPEARVLLAESDRKREEFIRGIFRQEPDRAEDYDLVFNSERLGVDEMKEIALLALLDKRATNQAEMLAAE